MRTPDGQDGASFTSTTDTLTTEKSVKDEGRLKLAEPVPVNGLSTIWISMPYVCCDS